MAENRQSEENLSHPTTTGASATETTPLAERLRALPSVDRLLSEVDAETAALPPALLADLARATLAEARARIKAGGTSSDLASCAWELRRRARELGQPRLRQVINASGVIIHTNLGRAPLSRAAIRAMEDVTVGYSNLEFDLDTGGRGSRHSHLDQLIVQVTGAEAGFAVNNNASALLLALSSLCAGRQAVISRGELVEIGGGFRIPDVMRQSGAQLVEVGTTNRTYLRDYENATTSETAIWLRVHTSNFRIVGFTTTPEARELVDAAHQRGLLLLDDIGSGALLDTTVYALAAEPTAQERLRAGADLVLFSGDKLLGGPQAGILAGRRSVIEQLRRHPLARAVRADKATIAALAATLSHYVRGEALSHIPVWQMIAAPPQLLAARVEGWCQALNGKGTSIPVRSMIGGGSLPEEGLVSTALALDVEQPDAIAKALRTGFPAVVPRIERGRLLFDARTVLPEQDMDLINRLRAVV